VEVAKLMDNMTGSDLGLVPPSQKPGPSSPIHTQTIYAGPDFELVVFLFPVGSSLPLHDHPEMVVFSKVLYGSLRMRCYNWLEPSPSPASLDGAVHFPPDAPPPGHTHSHRPRSVPPHVHLADRT
jgi:quercetin dioxygenase-like cupin family protein